MKEKILDFIEKELKRLADEINNKDEDTGMGYVLLCARNVGHASGLEDIKNLINSSEKIGIIK